MQEGPKTYISGCGNWVLEDAVYVPKKGNFLSKISHIALNPEKAIYAHERAEDVYLTDEQVEECLADCVELKEGSIPTNRFGDNEITRYIFGEDAEEYGEFLRNYGRISKMPVSLADTQQAFRTEYKPFAQKVCFKGLWSEINSKSNFSNLSCNLMSLHGRFIMTRGVRENISDF